MSLLEHRRMMSLLHAVVPGVGQSVVAALAKTFGEFYVTLILLDKYLGRS